MSALRLVETDIRSEAVSVDARYPQVIRQAIGKLNELTQLPDNWDSYGGRAPTKDALMGAVQLAMDLFDERTPIPDVFPVPNGNIQFEWACLGLDIEIEIESNRKCIACFEDLESGENWERAFTFDLTELRKVISELTARNQPQNRLRAVNA